MKGVTTSLTFEVSEEEQPFVILPIYLNGKGPYRFILDTGAGLCLVSKEVADEAQLPRLGEKTSASVFGPLTLQRSQIANLSVGETTIPDVEAGISNELERYRPYVSGKPLDGAIGYSFIRHVELQIDYPNRQVSLTPPTLRDQGVPFVERGEPHLVIIEGDVGRQDTHLAVDTGALVNVLSPTLADRLGITYELLETPVPGGGSTKIAFVELPTIVVGGRAVDAQAALVMSILDDISRKAGIEVGMVMGFPILSQFRVTISYRNKRLMLE
jgi:predicted aspartyl protease